MAITLLSRTLDGINAPAQGTWQIDPSHSSVGFSVRHLMVAKVRGRFSKFGGTLHIAERPEDSWAEVTIQAASIDTHDEKRDGHLRSPDFFDAGSYPTLTFKSVGLRPTGRTTFELPGELTIRGVTRPVVLAVEYDGITVDPWGGTRAAFSATAQIDREEFGLTWNQALESGGVLVGKQVKIDIEVQAVHSA